MKPSDVLMSLSLLLCCAKAANSHPNTVELALKSRSGEMHNFQYYVNLTVGTPGQPQSVFIDTGSSNTFVFASNASLCKASSCDGGTFELSKSSTYEETNHRGFQQAFMGGSTEFYGDYVRDVVQMSMQNPFQGQAQIELLL